MPLPDLLEKIRLMSRGSGGLRELGDVSGQMGRGVESGLQRILGGAMPPGGVDGMMGAAAMLNNGAGGGMIPDAINSGAESGVSAIRRMLMPTSTAPVTHPAAEEAGEVGPDPDDTVPHTLPVQPGQPQDFSPSAINRRFMEGMKSTPRAPAPMKRDVMAGEPTGMQALMNDEMTPDSLKEQVRRNLWLQRQGQEQPRGDTQFPVGEGLVRSKGQTFEEGTPEGDAAMQRIEAAGGDTGTVVGDTATAKGGFREKNGTTYAQRRLAEVQKRHADAQRMRGGQFTDDELAGMPGLGGMNPMGIRSNPQAIRELMQAKAAQTAAENVGSKDEDRLANIQLARNDNITKDAIEYATKVSGAPSGLKFETALAEYKSKFEGGERGITPPQAASKTPSLDAAAEAGAGERAASDRYQSKIDELVASGVPDVGRYKKYTGEQLATEILDNAANLAYDPARAEKLRVLRELAAIHPAFSKGGRGGVKAKWGGKDMSPVLDLILGGETDAAKIAAAIRKTHPKNRFN